MNNNKKIKINEKTMVGVWIESRRWGVSRARESNEGK